MITKKKLFRSFPTTVIYLAVVVSFMSNFYDFDFVLIGNSIGYSVLFNLVILYFLKQLKYCIHTRIAMLNLTLLSLYGLLNGLGVIDYDTYYLTYDTTTIIIMFLTMLIYSVKK